MLEEASNKRHPLLERLRFLSISANNLDEFYMVRVAGLVDMLQTRVDPAERRRPDAGRAAGGDPRARPILMPSQQDVLGQPARRAARGRHRRASSRASSTESERTWLDQYFLDQIFPVLTPLAIDPAHPFPVHPQPRLLDHPEAAAHATTAGR